MNRPAPFRQVDVKRLIKGALDAGLPADSFKVVLENGRPTILPIGAPTPSPMRPAAEDLDAEIEEFERSRGYG